MKNTTLVIGVIIVLLVVSGFFLLSRQSSNPAGQLSPSEKIIIGENATPDSGIMTGRYIEFSPAVLDQNVDKRRVLYFYASWCPTCRPADANFKANVSKIPEDVVVIRVNYNDPETDAQEKELAAGYGITYQHTFVQIDASGNEITKWNGGQIEELIENIK